MGTVAVGRRELGDPTAVVAAAVAVALLLGVPRVPDAALFGGLAAGIGRALGGRRPFSVPRRAKVAAQAVVGVSIGALVQVSPRSPRSARTGCRCC